MEAEHQGKKWLEIKSLEQKEDLMASFHRGPMPLLGVEGHTTTADIAAATADITAAATTF
jgi:hypothetical protein